MGKMHPIRIFLYTTPDPHAAAASPDLSSSMVQRRGATAPPPTTGRRRGRAPPAATGLRTKRDRAPPAGKLSVAAGTADNLAKDEVMRVLFETPSGFAILSFDGGNLCRPDARENIWANFADADRARYVVWLRQFKTFEDKSSAIRLHTGVDRNLPAMIKKWCRSGEMLVVGKPEYKTIIETSMGIPCLHDEIVMEVMWGLKNIMPSLVPQEKSQFTREDRLPMSQGLKRFLLVRFGFDVKPEMVNERIILAAATLLDCELIEKKYFAPLKRVGEHIKAVSGIDTKCWSLLKLPTSLMIIFFPERIVAGNPETMFTDVERLKLHEGAQEYDDKIFRSSCPQIYDHIVCTRKARPATYALLFSLVKEAKKAYAAERSAQESQQTS